MRRVRKTLQCDITQFLWQIDLVEFKSLFHEFSFTIFINPLTHSCVCVCVRACVYVKKTNHLILVTCEFLFQLFFFRFLFVCVLLVRSTLGETIFYITNQKTFSTFKSEAIDGLFVIQDLFSSCIVRHILAIPNNFPQHTD